MSTGIARQCYCGKFVGDVFADVSKPLPEMPIGKCQMPHCFNGHAFLTLGCIPDATTVRFGDIRNRVCEDSSEWLQPEMKEFLNSVLVENNSLLDKNEKRKYVIKSWPMYTIRKILPQLRTLHMKRHK